VANDLRAQVGNLSHAQLLAYEAAVLLGKLDEGTPGTSNFYSLADGTTLLVSATEANGVRQVTLH
jgi:hypothetical protein